MKSFTRYVRGGIKQFLVQRKIKEKWLNDITQLPLTSDHFELYSIIHKLTNDKLRAFPDLIRCESYNEKIQWLKLFDQQKDIVTCSDKILVKEYAKDRLGFDCTPQTYQIARKFEEIEFDGLPQTFVIKTNHDSGTVILVKDKANLDVATANSKISKSLNRVYGVEKGEWAYALIEPKVLVEEYIGPVSDCPPPDYKFHCVNGRVRWLHYIYDRGKDTKEIIVMPDGSETRIHFYHKIQSGSGFKKPLNWSEMIAMAEKLSSGFKYVRVDLYSSENRIYLGKNYLIRLVNFICYQKIYYLQLLG